MNGQKKVLSTQLESPGDFLERDRGGNGAAVRERGGFRDLQGRDAACTIELAVCLPKARRWPSDLRYF